MASGPSGLEDVSKYPNLVAEFERRDVQEADMLGIMGRNFIRVLQAVEDIALSKQHERLLEDDVKPFFSIATATQRGWVAIHSERWN
ncbi:hypothetical protein EKO27_g5290 [Xylaria grammica]|uniref:Dipeptidase n=1 Tax=Xylaria grammica TaxID=363999 RepID=A0A439D5X8_9PEZI|nr:hypothetical protein EKO27_g5290 [Xylaria grammica]